MDVGKLPKARQVVGQQKRWNLSWMQICWLFLVGFLRDFIKRNKNLNPGGCSKGTTVPVGKGRWEPAPSSPWGCCFPGKPRGCVRSRQVAVYWEEDPTLARQEVEGGGNNSKHREGWGSRCSSWPAPCGNPWSRPCSLGTVAALAEGVMDMTVRPLPRSHSNPLGRSWSQRREPGSCSAHPAPREGAMGTCPRPVPAPRRGGNSQRASKAWCQPGESRPCCQGAAPSPSVILHPAVLRDEGVYHLLHGQVGDQLVLGQGTPRHRVEMTHALQGRRSGGTGYSTCPGLSLEASATSQGGISPME